MADSDALRRSRGAGGENDPRVVIDCRRLDDQNRRGARMRRTALKKRRLGPEFGRRGERPSAGNDAAHCGLTEHQIGPVLWVVSVDGHVGGPGGEHGKDRDVELARAGGHPDSHAVSARDPSDVQPSSHLDDPRHELAITECSATVVESRRFRMPRRRLPKDIEQRARVGSEAR